MYRAAASSARILASCSRGARAFYGSRTFSSSSFRYNNRSARNAATLVAIPAGLAFMALAGSSIHNDSEKTSQPEESQAAVAQIDENDIVTEPKPLTLDDAKTEVEPEKEGEGEEEQPQGAFNPETGEINWDCPCLGGMAEGPCGEEFKAAFSCFVYSTEEPKGIDCVEKFKGMQECFRKHPEVYAEQLADEDPLETANEPAQPAQSEQTEKAEQPKDVEQPEVSKKTE
uniref:Mitochondrial intermembrane space import and assembly protein 40 n=1 Tax=Blastobotrys adeninivorans TaxID=409370 RepID=A0A060SYP7_BLAAD